MLHQTQSKVSLAPSYQTLDPHASTTGSYQVGKSQVSFVEPTQLHRHLRLLGAFSSLRKKVESSHFAGIAEASYGAKWTVFAHNASYRYELYVKEVVAAGTGTVTLPPLDVAMVFHTHLLNPTVFAEDKMRTFPELDLLSDRLLTQFVDSIDSNTFEHSPTNDEISNWQNRTSTPFDPLEAFAASSGRTIVCPQSGNEIHVPWVNSEGTGFAQEGFQVLSPNGFMITHENLGIAKLSQDLFEMKQDQKRGIARTMLTAHNALASGPSSLSLKISSKLLDLPIIANARTCQDIGAGLEWKRENAFKLVAGGVGGTKQFRLINEILEGYTTGSPFSIDLAFATLRQANFIEKMTELRWTSREWLSTPPEQNEILLHSIARYHAFMDLLSSSFSLFAVPTLDIDLAWHTHQLQSSYRVDTAQAVGRAIDHNDKVEETDLGWGFDDTAKLWEERFKVPYHFCGCPLPQTSTSDKALSKFSSSKLGAKFGLSSSSSPTTSGLEQPPSAHSATHSSEHNSFILTHHPDAQRRRKTRQETFGDRKKKEDKKREKELKKVTLGGGEESEIERRKLDHDLFFLRPVPLFEKFGEEGYPVSEEGVPLSANQAGSNRSKGSCGGSARDGIAASTGSCGAASGVFLVQGPTGGGNLAGIVNGGFSAIAASGVAGGMVSGGM